MKWILIYLLFISAGLSAHTPVERIPCEMIFMSDGEVLLGYDGHIYEFFMYHSKECSCDIVFEVDDPDD